MPKKLFGSVLFLLSLGTFGGGAAHGQTDVAVSLLGAFGSATNYNIGLEHQRSANAAGGLFEFRQVRNPIVGYEATYSFNRANQVYSYTGTTPACPPTSECVDAPNVVSANAHEIAGDWLLSAHVARFRPFALVGVGVLFTEPTSATFGLNTTTSSEPVYVYGAGLDWRLAPRIGLRLQYRGSVYKAPNVTPNEGSNGDYMHIAEPMIGAYFRF